MKRQASSLFFIVPALFALFHYNFNVFVFDRICDIRKVAEVGSFFKKSFLKADVSGLYRKADLEIVRKVW